jgi:putative tricarboxylic transport membrane protein
MDFSDILSNVFSPEGIFVIFLGVCLGILGGALPGISTTMTVALIATVTYTMDTILAIMLLASAQVGSTYGGSIAATVLNIPGTPSAAATAIEGYLITKKGQGADALAINVVSSFIGNTIGVILLLITIPLIIELAMLFGPWEMFWFSIFGLVICANLSRANFLKGLIAACFGLFLAMVGKDPIGGVPRFTFDSRYLLDGINLIPAMVGLYGMSEVLTSLTDHKLERLSFQKQKYSSFAMWYKYKWLSIRAAVLGFIIGVVPGIGPNIAAFVGYDHAYSSSKEKEKFGTGHFEGLVGSETANNACAPGTYAPMFVLGVPGDAVTAIILSMLMIHGLQPGPNFLVVNPEFLYNLAISLFIAGIAFLAIGSIIGKGITKILRIPIPAIMAGVALLCVIGSYAVSYSIYDVYLMFVFGILGVFMKKYGFPSAPLILGIVLGGSLIDANFRKGFIAGQQSFEPFFTRPVSIVLILIILFVVFSSYIFPLLKGYLKNKRNIDGKC